MTMHTIDMQELNQPRRLDEWPMSTRDIWKAFEVPTVLADGLARRLRAEAVHRNDGKSVLRFLDSHRYLTARGYADSSVRCAMIRYETRQERRD